mmetsp:Transcript_51137/g.110971  ORF Transcript_51137/g.110971 Transcript_51137/m.110971 type:complete len:464 (+) Transcript_51137:96-1487(+)|eukprot:CAMPEP_0170604566 /NCGR_PEP_ID=MMETSP0224-20130122/19491_1 /TAXON_ID=285029 /ORGANISM="Togula jolla, Strain CCCM 725" /LENGTH=463 /DNA_ID=CAMNT_0010929477 /DNA_START=36 /DNA_END=1427 /DNA_ORIENTATION=+
MSFSPKTGLSENQRFAKWVEDQPTSKVNRRTVAGMALVLLLSALYQPEDIHIMQSLIAVAMYVVREANRARPSRFLSQSLVPEKTPSSTSMQNQASSRQLQKQTSQFTRSRKDSPEPPRHLKFEATGFEAQVSELLGHISRQPESAQLAAWVAKQVEKVLRPSFPGATVDGFAIGNPRMAPGFVMASSEIMIVVRANTEQLLKTLSGEWNVSIVERKKLRKCAIRFCANLLTTKGGFRFRHSGYAAEYPLVSLLAPVPLGFQEEPMCIDLAVNSAKTVNMVQLISRCNRHDDRAASLILLVRRWARTRAVAHAAKGHLSEYAWCLLTVFFLQVAPGSDSPMPPLTDGNEMKAPQKDRNAPRKSVAKLFEAFMAFYARDFAWQYEGVSVRLGHRTGLRSLASKEVPLVFEDTFHLLKDPSADMAEKTLSRLREEICRADVFIARGASLSEVFEQWMPTSGEACT